MSAWDAVAAGGSVASAVAAAYAAWQSRSSAREANNTASRLAAIEKDRRHSELCPRFRVSCEPLGPGTDKYRLNIMLCGPRALSQLDRMTFQVRDDFFTRGQEQLLGGLKKAQVEAQIWGPYRVSPGTGSHGSVADDAGRTFALGVPLPTGETVLLQLEATPPPPWSQMTPSDWLRQQGTVLRFALRGEVAGYDSWTLPCELEVDPGARTSVTLP